jgi:hypothetical protein
MDLVLMDSISRFRAELDQIECEIRRFDRLYDLHRRHTAATHDRNRGMTPEDSTGPTVITRTGKKANPPSDHAFELRGTLFVRILQESSGHSEINRAATI